MSDGEEGSTGLRCLALLLGFHQIASDVSQLRHAAGAAADPEPQELVRLARRMGARARLTRVRPDRLAATPLPAIAFATDGEAFLLASVREGEALVQHPGCAPQTITLEGLADRWTGELVLVTTRAEVGGASSFDVTWFIPALVKYRGLLGEVLLASFVLQLFALATPLIFQVVIDKVLVHKGLTTLDVLAIGLGSIAVFDAILSGLRAYVFTHTTNRVDVELGAKLYRHLLALPLAYFESRRVGDSVARVRELDTIREFLTSSSVTLLIDLLFTTLFLVVMWFYSKLLLLIVLVAIAAYIVICVLITPALRRRIDERFRRGAESQAFLVESVTGVQTLKARGGGAADAEPLGAAAGGLCAVQLQGGPAEHRRRPGDPAGEQAFHRRDPVLRRPTGGDRQADRGRAGGLQHAGRPRRRSGAEAGQSVAAVPGGARRPEPARRHPEHAH